jgi:kinesin family protein 5
MLNQAETLSALRFGQRAKLIKNKVVANTQQSVKELMMLLKRAEEKIKNYEKILGTWKGDLDIGKNFEEEKNRSKCPQCKQLMNKINYLNIEMSNLSQENEYLQRDKDEFLDEIKNKNDENINLEERIYNLEKELKNSWQEHFNMLTEIKESMDNYMNSIKSIKKESIYKNWIELMNKLNLEQKLNKLQENINNIDDLDIEFKHSDSDERIEEINNDFKEKEKQYIKTIEELKY